MPPSNPRGHASQAAGEGSEDGPSADEANATIASLKRELGATREYLQSVIEQQELAIERLRERNEELARQNTELLRRAELSGSDGEGE